MESLYSVAGPAPRLHRLRRAATPRWPARRRSARVRHRRPYPNSHGSWRCSTGRRWSACSSGTARRSPRTSSISSSSDDVAVDQADAGADAAPGEAGGEYARVLPLLDHGTRDAVGISSSYRQLSLHLGDGLVRCMHVRPAVHPLGMRCGGVQEVAARRSRASEGPLRPRFRVQPEAACSCSESVQRGALDGCRFYVTVHPRRRWGCERRHSRRNTRWYYTRAVTTQVDVSRRYGGYRHTQDMTYTPVPSLSELAQKALQLAYVLRGEALRRSHVWRWHSPNPQ